MLGNLRGHIQPGAAREAGLGYVSVPGAKKTPLARGSLQQLFGALRNQ